jgi:hypothetical protein
VLRYFKKGLGCYLVTARRKPRGYIIACTETIPVIRMSATFAMETWRTINGWRPVGFNKVRGQMYHTRADAANALVSDHRFESKPDPEDPYANHP